MLLCNYLPCALHRMHVITYTWPQCTAPHRLLGVPTELGQWLRYHCCVGAEVQTHAAAQHGDRGQRDVWAALYHPLCCRQQGAGELVVRHPRQQAAVCIQPVCVLWRLCIQDVLDIPGQQRRAVRGQLLRAARKVPQHQACSCRRACDTKVAVSVTCEGELKGFRGGW